MMATKMIPTTFAQDLPAGNVKAAMKSVNAGSGDLWRVPIDQLHVLPGLNVRTKSEEYESHVNTIVASILAEGFYADKPIGVFVNDEGLILVRDGHTRLEAAKRAIKMGAQIEALPCVTSPRGTTMVDVTIGLVKSNTGRPLAPIEVAVVCKRLVGWGWEVKAIAERLDYTEPYVNDLLGLLDAPESLLTLVSAGKVSASTAIKATKTHGVKAATEKIVAAAKAAPGKKVTAKTLKPGKTKSAAKPGSKEELIDLLRDLYTHEAFNEYPSALQVRVAKALGDE